MDARGHAAQRITGKIALDILDVWLPAIASHGRSSSYPSWLLEELGAGARLDQREWAS